MKSALRPTKRRKDDYLSQTLHNVPMDVWTYIFRFLTNDEILSLRILSRSWKRIVEHSTIWQDRFLKLLSIIESNNFTNDYFNFYDMMGKDDWIYSLYYINCFGLWNKLNVSNANGYIDSLKYVNQFALFLSRHGHTQFLSHWMFAIYKCRLRQTGYKTISECKYDDMTFIYFWELRDDTTVVLKDLSKFREQTIGLEVTFVYEGQRRDILIVYHTNAKSWNRHFNTVEFDIREKQYGFFVTPHDAFVKSTVSNALLVTIKLYQSPFHEMGEKAREVCTKILNTNFQYVYVE